MRLDRTKRWWLAKARAEGDVTIGAGQHKGHPHRPATIDAPHAPCEVCALCCPYPCCSSKTPEERAAQALVEIAEAKARAATDLQKPDSEFFPSLPRKGRERP